MILNSEDGFISLGVLSFELERSPDPATLDAFLAVSRENVSAAAASPGFNFSRRLYRSFQVDPTRHRPSSEALLRRVSQGLLFPRVTAVVDAVNRLSLRHMVPYGLYDQSRIFPPLRLRRGLAGEGYEGIRKGWLSMEGKIVLADERGPFGNPSGDSSRSSVDETSRRILGVIFFHPEDPRKEAVLSDSWAVIEELFSVAVKTELF